MFVRLNKVLSLVITSVLALPLLLTACTPTSGQAQQAPDFQLQNLEGQTVRLSDFRGKPVILNFWATWCPPCREEMPLLQEIYTEWSPRGVVMLAVNIGEGTGAVKEFLNTNGYTMPVLLDTTQKVADMYNVRGIPTTLFIDREGNVRDRITGAFSSKGQIEGYIKNLNP